MRLRSWLLLAALLGSPAVAQRTPEALVQALQAAARAGDAQAYQALLGGSGTFRIEGANFAADLKRVPQPSVTYLLSEVRMAGDQARARLTLSWERVKGVPSRATLPVRLERVGEVWRYAGEDLQAIPAAPYALFAVNEAGLPERAAPLAPLLGRAAGRVREALGIEVPATATVKVYPNMDSLSASVNLSLQPVGGWNEPGEAIKLILSDGPSFESSALRLLAHEFTHLSVSAAVGEGSAAGAADRRVPWWLHEGLADHVSRAYWTPSAVTSRQERMTGYARAGWVPLEELRDFPAVPEERWKYVYAQGLGVVDFLAATKGQGAPLALARAFAASTSGADEAARSLGYASFAALEEQARAWLAAR
ncbi:hypothetical protein [Deinococcus koreensis]|uniref:Peptidase MA-like domain-containing protein n=1 Tax=Deinococcus koreensis TaxID=2054903 RepID=A0A2K3V0G3_9DEIO|nr:hypothetical protein [Deinococcus koreensis]PNY82274.1 hypothetical protein CVO96_13705 [Deinococcus koreensis]